MKNNSKLQNPNVIYQRVRDNRDWYAYRTYKNEWDARRAFQVINRNNPDIEYRRGSK